MRIKQVLNNNVVMALDDHDKEVVVVGTGIGFMAKKGDAINESKVQKVYETAQNKMLVDIIRQIAPEMLDTCEQIKQFAQKSLNIKMDDDVFLLLTDHINFALKRLKDDMVLDNPFVHEIKQFFPGEYEVGLFAKKILKERYDVEIPEEEVGYIAMHLISSQFHQKRSAVNKVFEIIDCCVDYIEANYFEGVELDSLAYNRLITHIKFFAQRYIEDKEAVNKDELLNLTINEVFKKEAECIEGLSKDLYQKFGKEVTQSERNYIILHLRNCLAKD